jgi:hypothetical protein
MSYRLEHACNGNISVTDMAKEDGMELEFP